MRKFVAIHGHFYQPPRENPWTGEVDQEESAKPFHDWNERIAKECYEANAKAPILDEKGEVVEHVNNFKNISFDIGPTLLSWLKRKDPETYEAILQADRVSIARRDGHGNALAQVYNHMIMPLAFTRDKETQIIWGIRDFEFHFKRKPEGMWLSETAVDRETLKILADNGILFTILAPHQARRARRVGFGSRWQALSHETVDPRHPYRILLDHGKHFHLFFYDGPISRAIAFQGLLSSGDELVRRLLGPFGRRESEQIVSTATDGETFGHHHKFGEMAIAYGLKKLEAERLARLTNFGEFLDAFGSHWEADVHENSSWSCSHGVERWRSDCGCRIHYEEGWNQKWRSVLRTAFDELKKEIDRLFEVVGGRLLKNPWEARNDYIRVILEDSLDMRKSFLARHARVRSTDDEKRIWSLLEAEKFSMLMYTSCGWFFDDISGLEAAQVMKFALRALELAQPFTEKDLEGALLALLAQANSNFPEQGTGAEIFRKYVKPLQTLAGSSKLEAGRV